MQTSSTEAPRPTDFEGAQLDLLRPLVALFAAFAILILGNGLASTLLVLGAGRLGASDALTGALTSGYYAGYAAGAVLGAALVRRAGPVRTFAALASLVSAMTLVHALVPSVPAWVLLRIATGARFAVLVLVVEAWINAATPTHARGRTLSLYGLTFLMGGAGSQQLLNIADPAGFALFAVASILVSLSLVPVTLARVREPEGLGGGRLGLGALWSASPFGVASVIAVAAAVAAFWGLGPAYARAAGLDDAALSVFMSAALGAAALTQWPMGWLSDRVDRRLVLIGALAIAALSSGALWLLAPTGPVLIALAAMFGAGVQPAYSLAVAHANDRLPGRAVEVAGGLILPYGMAAAAAPLLAGAAMDAAGPGALFGTLALTTGGTALLGAARLRRAAVPEADKRAYEESPRTTHAATYLSGSARA